MTHSELELVFSSELFHDRRDELEQLLYFNTQQTLLLEAISSSVEEFGSPHVIERDGRLGVEVERLPGLQALFALRGHGGTETLVGVVLYGRPSLERLVVLHLAVAEEYCSQGLHADLMLPLRLLDCVRTAAKRLKGAETVVMPYGRGLTVRMRVRRGDVAIQADPLTVSHSSPRRPAS